MSIVVDGISKYFGKFQALHDVSLELPEGKLTALLGPSGSGKTTLLRIIAGLESAERGRILFNGQDVTALHVRDRNIGFVFQHYALFRHLTVAQNIAFGLDALPRRERPSKPEPPKERVPEQTQRSLPNPPKVESSTEEDRVVGHAVATRHEGKTPPMPHRSAPFPDPEHLP